MHQYVIHKAAYILQQIFHKTFLPKLNGYQSVFLDCFSLDIGYCLPIFSFILYVCGDLTSFRRSDVMADSNEKSSAFLPTDSVGFSITGTSRNHDGEANENS